MWPESAKFKKVCYENYMPDSNVLVHILTIVDGETEELLHLVELTEFKIEEFHLQFDVDPIRDPEMLDRYSVGPDDISFLEGHLRYSMNFDFSRFAYFIEAARKK